jgi:hypothetical protein
VSKSDTVISMHAVKNMLGDNRQIQHFEDHDEEFAKEFDIPLSGTIERFGIDLTDVQARVMESILKKFSELSFEGNIPPQSREEYVASEYSGKAPSILKYIPSLPRLRIRQCELMDALGIGREDSGDWERAVNALHTLGVKQYCYFYDRLSMDEKRVGQYDKFGKPIKEEVVVVDTLFKIAHVLDENTKALKYYEITPSPIFLDQRESYFLLVPNNWREEVRLLFGSKKSSSYTFRLLLFLMYQGELKRRGTYRRASTSNLWTIEMKRRDIAESIKMPQSVIKRNKKRMDTLLEDSYQIAKKLGYLTAYSHIDGVDTLVLNQRRYHSQNRVDVGRTFDLAGPVTDQFTDGAKEAYEKYHREILSIDPSRTPPQDSDMRGQLSIFEELVSARGVDQTKSFISWAVNHRFWGKRVLSMNNLTNEEAWFEFLSGTKDSMDCLRAHAEAESRSLKKRSQLAALEVLAEGVSVYYGSQLVASLSFEDKGFRSGLEEVLRKLQAREGDDKRMAAEKRSSDKVLRKIIDRNMAVLAEHGVQHIYKPGLDRVYMEGDASGIWLGQPESEFIEELTEKIGCLGSGSVTEK